MWEIEMPRHEARIIYDSSISTLLNINFHKLKERRSEQSLKYRLRVSMPCESDRDKKEDGMGIEINTTSGTVPDVAADFFPFNVILDGIKSFVNWVTWREKFNFQLVAIVYKENKSSCFNFWDGFFFVVDSKGHQVVYLQRKVSKKSSDDRKAFHLKTQRSNRLFYHKT